MSRFQLNNHPPDEPIDQRMAPRYAVDIPVELLFVDGGHLHTHTRDISASGIFVPVTRNRCAGKSLRFLITFPEEITTSCKLYALCEGMVVRRELERDYEGLAIKIERYQFLSSAAA